MVREAVFNLLGDAVVDARVLDLFSGSGALGIEALSRGAHEVTFVELAHSSVSILRRNLETLGYESQARVVRGEAVRWLRNHAAEVAVATLVFLDPPYRDPALRASLQLLDEHSRPGAKVVAEHAHSEALPSLRRLRVVTRRRYGDTAISILRAEDS
jgi:16S rRNA (guanine966-N2)-methyltransferase